MKGQKLAEEYERRYPGTGIPQAQAAERMERILARDARGTRRSRFVTVPEMPWHRKEKA